MDNALLTFLISVRNAINVFIDDKTSAMATGGSPSNVVNTVVNVMKKKVKPITAVLDEAEEGDEESEVKKMTKDDADLDTVLGLDDEDASVAAPKEPTADDVRAALRKISTSGSKKAVEKARALLAKSTKDGSINVKSLPPKAYKKVIDELTVLF